MENIQKEDIESRGDCENNVAAFLSNNYLFHLGMIEISMASDMERAMQIHYQNSLILHGG